LDFKRKVIEVDRLHDARTLQKYQIDALERIYNKLGIREVKINQFVGGSEQSNLASILPSLGFAMGQLNTAESKWDLSKKWYEYFYLSLIFNSSTI